MVKFILGLEYFKFFMFTAAPTYTLISLMKGFQNSNSESFVSTHPSFSPNVWHSGN